MIRLELLGGIELIDPANPGASALVGRRKRFALLAYLALGRPGTFRSRDAVLALFWPESDAARARNSLSQAVHHLRVSLGSNVIVTLGESALSTSPSTLWCDAVAFEQALANDAEEALNLYRGDLLPSFYVDGAPDFERWLDDERSRLRRLARDAAWRLAAAAEGRQDLPVATRWARCSARLSYDNEVSFQQLLHLLHRVGDKAGALHAYQEFAAHLSADFDDVPSAATRRVMDMILTEDAMAAPDPGDAGSGLRSTHDASPVGDTTIAPDEPLSRDDRARDSTSDPETRTNLLLTSGEGMAGEIVVGTRSVPAVIDGHALRRLLVKRSLARFVAVALAVVSLSGLGVLLRVTFLSDHDGAASSHIRIVVRDFVDLATPSRRGVLAPAIAAAIVDDLAAVRSFDVVLASVQGEPAGRRMRVMEQPRFVVTGRVLQSAGSTRVSVALTDAVAGSTVGTAVFEREDSSDPIALVGTVSRDISSMVRVAIGRDMRTRDRSLAAVDRRARRLAEEAVAERERARGLERGGRLPGAVRALRRADSLLAGAESIAPGWREPTIERARVMWEMAVLHLAPGSRDTMRAGTLLQAGIAHAERAVASDRRDAAALETLGLISYWYWLHAPLAVDSARAVLARARNALRGAVAIDPDRASAWSLLSAALFTQADYSGAYLAADRAYQADTYLDDTQEILGRLFMAAYEVGDDTLARHWCEEIDYRFRRSWTGAYCRLGLLAWPGSTGDPASTRQAWAIATRGNVHATQLRDMGPRLSMLVAAVLARVGLRDSAEASIRRSRSSAAGDPEILPLEASARIVLGQPDSAIACLARYVRAKPLHRAAVACSRRFAGLRALHPEAIVFQSCGT